MPIVSSVISEEMNARLEVLKKRDKTSTSRLIKEMIEMAIDRREEWRPTPPPPVELPKPPKL